MLAALLIGGASRPRLASDLILQLMSIPLLALALWQWSPAPAANAQRWINLVPVLLLALLAAVTAAQLIPLPPEIWQALPGRETIVETYRTLGVELPWRPLSVAPSETYASLLSLVVPASIFLAVCQLDALQRRTLTLIVLAVAAASVVLGLTQVAFGSAGAIRFYDFSNQSEATGFFANRNHYAALLFCAFLLSAVWAGEAHQRFIAFGRRRPFYVALLAAALLLMIALLAAQSMARSRAGLLLAIVAMVGALALAFMTPRQTQGRISTTKILATVFAIASVLGAQFALYRIMQRFDADPLQDARVHFAQTTAETAYKLMPFGAGLGSFESLYGVYEKIENLLPNTFANRAHNDLLEFWLELGLFAALILAAFIIWLGIRAVAVWRRSDEYSLDTSLMRAAVLIVGLLLLHSLVDYPLRTGAMAAVFALACGLLMPPPRSANDRADAPSAAEPRSAPKPQRSGGTAGKRPFRLAPEHHAKVSAETLPPRAATSKDARSNGAGTRTWTSPEGWPEEWKKGDRES
ncbi:O-antigen ligase family protein [Hyphomicrobium sp. D-2]|uniref:O-antigen ligase family protein n=1 Tax=Hyphomicrobium sp. D-2 TaxID=3041621 RepID=UPI00245383AE|nr:O-antigen ligase family protein [Hyphomicrobium sp. D-2]MDH4980688.1 O-antigen ligase family protein [Hyphomicrobium sp. D-2]